MTIAIKKTGENNCISFNLFTKCDDNQALHQTFLSNKYMQKRRAEYHHMRSNINLRSIRVNTNIPPFKSKLLRSIPSAPAKKTPLIAIYKWSFSSNLNLSVA